MMPRRPRALTGKRRQRGMLGVLAAILLVVGVLLILNQTLGTLTARSVDTTRQLDSTAAFALAESGLQRAQGIVTGATTGSTMDAATCSAMTNSGPFTLGRGSYTFGTATPLPANCDATTNPCSSCEVNVTGTVGTASRSLKLKFDMGVVNGVTGKGTTVTMVLKNTFDVPAVSLFNLAWRRQGTGGQADATYCANGATDCGLRWNTEAQAGQNDVGGMGISVRIPASTLSKIVTQTLNKSRAYTEVGALFPSTSSASYPTVIGSYWKDTNPGNNNKTVGTNNVDTGQTNSGVATTNSASCDAAPGTYGSGSEQSCTSWCSGNAANTQGSADTLVFGVGGRSGNSSVTEEINSVLFNVVAADPSASVGWPAQSIPLTRVVHYPDTSGTIVSAVDVYSEVWYAYNPAYYSPLPTDGSFGATSYPAHLQGVMGAEPTVASIASGATTINVTAFALAGSKICIGDSVSDGSKFAAGTTITRTPTNPTGSVTAAQCSSGTGTYTISAAASNNNNPSVKIQSNKLVVTKIRGTLTTGTPVQKSLSNFVTPTAVLAFDASVYTTTPSSGTITTALTTFTQGTAGSTITLPSTAAVPAVGTMVSIYTIGTGGQGKFQAQTKVASVGANSFTVDKVPTTGLIDAAICGGVCAFFSNPSSTSATTDFTVNKTTNTKYWASGFMCLGGVDKTKIIPVTSTSSKATTWSEAIQ